MTPIQRRFLIAFLGGSALATAGLSCAKPDRSTAETSVKPGINDPYNNPDVSEWIARFETESREIYRERHRIVDALALEPGMIVADVGAGTGLFLPLLAAKVGPDGRVLAVDIVPEFLTHINQVAAEQNISNIETVLCTEKSVELPTESVDLVFVCDTYHHFEYPRSTLASIYRALRPGGRLVVVDFIRVPGTSRRWVLDHVRIGRHETAAEIIAAGFESLPNCPTVEGLKENYVICFRKPGDHG